MIIDGCIRGKTAMQKEFYYAFYSMLMKIAIRYAPSREDAEQWVHDGFLKVFAHLGQFKNEGSFEGWLKKVMTRTCIDNLRSRNALKFEVDNKTVYSNYEIPAHDQPVSNAIIQKFSAEEVLRLLKILPDKQRTVFNLHVFEEYGHKEIAEILGITENHSYWLLYQARKKLKERLTTTPEKKTTL